MNADDLKKRFQTLANRVDAMSLRERALIFVTILVALYFLAVNALFGPLNMEKDRLQQQLNQKRQETQALELQVQALAGGGEDPETAKRNKAVGGVDDSAHLGKGALKPYVILAQEFGLSHAEIGAGQATNGGKKRTVVEPLIDTLFPYYYGRGLYHPQCKGAGR